ncbi:MAG: TIR domain-containing protein [Bacteroidales bacterium]|nr:TIR domain-containing protein [Bacteroidales bacterium]
MAPRLYEYLRAKGYSVFLDRKEMSSGDYKTQIRDNIRKAKDVLILLEKNSLQSCFNNSDEEFSKDVFCFEICEALKKEKGVLPILLDDYKMPSEEELPKELNKLPKIHGVDFDTTDEIGEFYESELIRKGKSGTRLVSTRPWSIAAIMSVVLLGLVVLLALWIFVFDKKANASELERIFETGRSYYENRDFDNALKCFQQAAELGYPSAQCWMGTLYYRGRGVELDMKKAFEWDLKAAKQGHATAQCYVGNFYDRGEVVRQDFIEAAKWYKKSAFQGVADGQYNLGEYYYWGRGGIEQNDTLAFDCFERSSRQGYSKAQFRLGCMYEVGRFVQCNPRLAFEYYLCSAYQGYAPAVVKLGQYYEDGFSEDGLNIMKNPSEALRWYVKACDKNYPEGLIRAAMLYEEGLGTEENLTEALTLYKKAADQAYDAESAGRAKEAIRRITKRINSYGSSVL